MNILTVIISFVTALMMVLANTIPPPDSQPPTTTPQTPKLAAAKESDVSRNWAGYTTTTGKFTGVSGSWTIPHITDTSKPGADATWVGIGGIGSGDLIQIGTQATVGQFGRVTYSAFYETLPESSEYLDLTVHPGDAMDLMLTQTSSKTWTMIVKDKTTDQVVSLSIPYKSSYSSAEWIEEAPTGITQEIPLDNFGTVAITNAKAIQNGKSVTASDSGAKPIAMSEDNGTTLAQASVMDTDGASFTVSRVQVSNADSTDNQHDVGPFLIRKRIFRLFY